MLGFYHQTIWREMVEEIQGRHPNTDATFLVSYTRVYVEAQVMLIRRLADPDAETRSLIALVTRIGRNPAVVDRDRFLAHSADDEWRRSEDEAYWLHTFADPSDPERLDTKRLALDRANLADALAHVAKWADKSIAHLDPRKPERVLLYREIGDAFDVLADKTSRYQRLLTGASTDDWTPIFQGDWQEPFRPALFPISPDARAWPRPEGFS